MTERDIQVLLVAAIMCAVFGVAMFWLLSRGRKSVDAFYEEADRIEAMILAGEEFEIVFKDLVLLSDKSFHRSMGGRIRELAKMMEVKYGVKVLKR